VIRGKLETLFKILNGLNQTMIIATQDLDMARNLCSRVVVLREGGIVAEGGVPALLGDPVLLEDWGL
jgi:cobalt/nickel transport system ATP-binding protein